MRASTRIAGLCLLCTFFWAAGLSARSQTSTPDATASSPTTLGSLLPLLGDDKFTVRDETTRRVMALGPAVIPDLQQRLATENDPEIRHRLQYILEFITPPQFAALVLRPEPGSGLEPGDLITHLGSHRVTGASDFQKAVAQSRPGAILRVMGPAGPRELPLQPAAITTLSDYHAGHGPVIAEAVRLYANGQSEKAVALLAPLGESIPADEIPPLLLSRMAYTAGDGRRAVLLLSRGEPNPGLGTAGRGNEWNSPSWLDLAGPGDAPFHLEWTALSHDPSGVSVGDPDLRVQRVLVPAGRYEDSLLRSAELWWTRYRAEILQSSEAAQTAGNMLAVTSWMFDEMDLRSECCRLIEPRSALLRRTTHSMRKWTRVDTDAWLKFFAGDPAGALDSAYEDALSILRQPPRPEDPDTIIRNPAVAARIAFFLYQLPADPRCDEALREMLRPLHPALDAYAYWMSYAVSAGNYETIRKAMQQLLRVAPDASAERIARCVMLLEFVQARPDDQVMSAARQRLEIAVHGARRAGVLAWAEALQSLARGEQAPALRAANAAVASADLPPALAWTALFMGNAAWTGKHAALSRPILAVPMGVVPAAAPPLQAELPADNKWLIVARDQRLMIFDPASGALTALNPPVAWFPNPLAWPWIDRDSSSGRAWVLGLRRLFEVLPDGRLAPGLNIKPKQVAELGRVRDNMSDLLDAAATYRGNVDEEAGEFLRADVKAFQEYTSDPDLAELGALAAVGPDILQVTFRGGPCFLIDSASSRTWSSQWIGQQLGLDSPPRFWAQALPGDSGPATTQPAAPVLFLHSDQGLIRFDVASQALRRVALGDETPFPALTPEIMPYDRRDPRFVYTARLPEDGGRVFRLSLETDTVAMLAVINDGLPAESYAVRSRAELRREINRRLRDRQMPPINDLISDAAAEAAKAEQEPTP